MGVFVDWIVVGGGVVMTRFVVVVTSLVTDVVGESVVDICSHPMKNAIATITSKKRSFLMMILHSERPNRPIPDDR